MCVRKVGVALDKRFQALKMCKLGFSCRSCDDLCVNSRISNL